MILPPNRQVSFDVLCEFIQEQGCLLDKPALLEKYIRGLEWRGIPEIPKTHIDPVVVSIIQTKWGEETKQILETKKWITAVEVSIGYLLERYIDSKMTDGEWIWCTGSVIKSTDFIKKTDNGWLQLQIKNRNNTENSSSAAVRSGTKIKMWFRFFSQTGKTNWDTLPVLLGKDYGMNEPDFQKFVCSLVGETKMKKHSCLNDLLV
jgi:hypothetical protein